MKKYDKRVHYWTTLEDYDDIVTEANILDQRLKKKNPRDRYTPSDFTRDANRERIRRLRRKRSV